MYQRLQSLRWVPAELIRTTLELSSECSSTLWIISNPKSRRLFRRCPCCELRSTTRQEIRKHPRHRRVVLSVMFFHNTPMGTRAVDAQFGVMVVADRCAKRLHQLH